MDKPKWTHVSVPLGLMTPWALNPRRSTQKQAQRIVDSERKFGQPLPFLLMPEVNGRYQLLDGHQRWNAWIIVFGSTFIADSMVSDRLFTDKERQEFIITIHKGATGDWNWDVLSGWNSKELQTWGMDNDVLSSWNSDAVNLREMLTSDTTPDTDDDDDDETPQYDTPKSSSKTCPVCGQKTTHAV